MYANLNLNKPKIRKTAKKKKGKHEIIYKIFTIINRNFNATKTEF